MLRIAYVCEFLLALLAISVVWGQVGGQDHLDLMPWYWKAVLGIGMAWTIVRATAAAIEHQKAWNAKCIAWLLATLLLATAMGIATYYAHVHENDDDEDNPDNTTLTSTRIDGTISSRPA